VSGPECGWRINDYVHWPHVKNLGHHNSIFDFGRMQDVWLDRERPSFATETS
jgi:hypothetical protein